MRRLIKSLLPPIFLIFLKKFKINNYGWQGNYKTWQEASDASSGYDSNEIIQKVRASLLKVKNGEAIYERDSVIFDEIQYSWPLLAGLMYASAMFKGELNVLDFGGSLGSTYYQNKKFLDKINNLTWSIVEQDKFVKIGKKEFENEHLKFYCSVGECIAENAPNVLIFSSVLQYIEEPFTLLDDVFKHNFKYILVDITPFSSQNIIKLQRIPPSIYNASYPCWIFSEYDFIKYFYKNGYKVHEEFKSLNSKHEEFNFKGFIFEKL